MYEVSFSKHQLHLAKLHCGTASYCNNRSSSFGAVIGMCDLLMAPTTWGKELTSLNASFASLVSASPFGNLM